LRAVCIEQIVGQSSDRLPAWFELMQHAGIARIDTVGTVGFGNIGFERDAVLFALPIAAGLPQVLIYLALAGALAASLAALSASLMAAAAIVAEDVVHGLPNEMVPERVRINTARAGLVGAAFVTLGLAVSAADPLQLFLWSLTFSAAVSFPILFLAIWWERMNAWGALAGMVAGFVVTALIILLCETGAVPLASPLAGAFGLPCALLAILIVSLATPVPARNALGVVRDMRVPGGETIYDREIRLLRLKSRGPT
jgi:cation/acetate symporter